MYETSQLPERPDGGTVPAPCYPGQETGGRPAKYDRLAILDAILSKDCEYLPATSETIIYIAMIGLMIRRLAQK